MTGETVFIKWGGSVITDKLKPLTARTDVIQRLAQELKPFVGKKKILLGHGSGSFGHWAAKNASDLKTRNPRVYAAYVHSVAARLNQIVVDILVESGIPAFQFPPSAIFFSRDDYISRLCVGALAEVLDAKYLPVTYGDAVPDLVRGGTIFSTERVFLELNPVLKPSRIIFISSVNGVYTDDPNKNPDAEHIPEITPENFEEIKAYLGGSHGIDVTGGMLSKVEMMLYAIRTSPWLKEVIIASADPDNLKRIMKGEKVGTVIHH